MNYIILHLIESYRHSQLLPSVTLHNRTTFFVPAFLLSSIRSVLHFNKKTSGGDESIVNNYQHFLTAVHSEMSHLAKYHKGRGEQISGSTLPRRLNFVCWRLIFEIPQMEPAFCRHAGAQKFWKILVLLNKWFSRTILTYSNIEIY